MPTFDLHKIPKTPEAFIEAAVANPVDVATPLVLSEVRRGDLPKYLASLSIEKRDIVEGNVTYSQEIAEKTGIVLIGRGGDRTAFRDLETDTVYKVADRSQDPIGDYGIERLEIALCQEYYPGFTLKTIPEVVVGNSGRLMLLSTQPFIELWEDSKHTQSEGKIDITDAPEVPDEIIEGSKRLYEDRGLCLDGCAVQPDTRGNFWIIDTTLAPFGNFLGDQNPKSASWKEKSWRSFGLTQDDLKPVANTSNAALIDIGRM